MEDLVTVYQNRVVQFSQAAKELRKQTNWVVLLRTMVFLLGATGAFFAFKAGVQWGILTLVLFLGTFLWMVRFHLSLKKRYNHMQQLVQINKAELAALQGDVSAYRNGDVYRDVDHPFLHDLDIFGDESIFQTLNRTGTLVGEKQLAAWLTILERDDETILSRQAAVRELKKLLDWRQDFQAYGEASAEIEGDSQKVIDWVNTPIDILPTSIGKVLLYILPLFSFASLALTIFGVITEMQLLLALLLPLIIVGLFVKRVNKQQAVVSNMQAIIQKYARLLMMIEEQKFEEQYLITLQESVKTEGKTAGESIRKLGGIINALENRANVFVGLGLNAFLVWDLWCIHRLQNWQKEFKGDLHRWFDAIAEVDAVCSLAAFHFNHPGFVFPVPNDQSPVLTGVAIGHPLLVEKGRVDNDFQLQEQGCFTIITGANMAGKSTFLRAIGVNMVLAMAGAPVAAKKFEFRPVQLYTSMRTTDSLQKNESYFHSELIRLKAIVKQLEKGESTFIILDEILKGTNSKDKATGSKAFVKKIIGMQAAGIIATHDLSLCELASEFEGNIRNQCFEVTLTSNDVLFDYLLKDGVCKNMNATFLMKKMGITT